MEHSRRGFLIQAAGLSAIAYAVLRENALQRILAAANDAGPTPADALAGDEAYWAEIQRAFDVDRSIINLNNGGVNPSPRYVLDAMRRHLELTNHAPARQLWTVLDPQVETVRERLARTFGCDTEEMAITRNASESMEIAVCGLDLARGDEILTTTQDYPRMINTLKQRELRDGIVLRTFSFPNPPPTVEGLAEEFEKNITPRTKAILVSHITTYTGQVFPAKKICDLAKSRGITSIVDGAHAFGQIVYDGAAIGADFYGTSLHKWMHAPIGTGFLHVRKDRIAGHWPLMSAAEPKSNDIRKFEEIGTHPDANRLAITEALVFYEGIGPKRKEERLRYLRNRIAKRLAANPRVRLYTSLAPEQSCAIGTVGLEGIDLTALVNHLWNKHRIVVTGIDHTEVKGIRFSPNVYTTLSELDLFCDAVEHVLEHGLPV